MFQLKKLKLTQFRFSIAFANRSWYSYGLNITACQLLVICCFPESWIQQSARLHWTALLGKWGWEKCHLVLESVRESLNVMVLCMQSMKQWHWSFRLTLVLGKSSLGKLNSLIIVILWKAAPWPSYLLSFSYCFLFKPYYMSIIPVMKANGKTAFIENWNKKALLESSALFSTPTHHGLVWPEEGPHA